MIWSILRLLAESPDIEFLVCWAPRMYSESKGIFMCSKRVEYNHQSLVRLARSIQIIERVIKIAVN